MAKLNLFLTSIAVLIPLSVSRQIPVNNYSKAETNEYVVVLGNSVDMEKFIAKYKFVNNVGLQSPLTEKVLTRYQSIFPAFVCELNESEMHSLMSSKEV